MKFIPRAKPWILSASVTLVSALLTQDLAARECDLAYAKRIYTKCALCHSLEAGHHMMGPSLYNIVGAKAGSAEGYRYSAPMRNSDIVWSETKLDRFIESPMQFLPGTSMPFAGIRNEADRAALLCLLSNTNKAEE